MLVDLTALTEMLSKWFVREGSGGPDTSGTTDIGTGIMSTLVFLVPLSR